MPQYNESKKALKKEFVNLNFKVDTEVRRKIKTYTANHEMSLKKVFEVALDFYMKHHP